MAINTKSRERLQKTFSILTAMTTMLWVTGFAYLAPQAALAAAPSDFGLKEGQTISAVDSGDPDVFIVNQLGYKRLFLSPKIFGLYGHLGGFKKVKHVSPAIRDAFTTSGLFRNCEINDPKVYAVEVTGKYVSDTGIFHWVNVAGDQAVAQDSNFFKKVFCINNAEFNLYQTGSAYTALSQVPVYTGPLAGGVTSGPIVSGSPTPVAGAVTFSLASNNPAAATLTQKATGVTFMSINVAGNGTVSSVKVTRRGPGSTSDFSNVYLYDGPVRLTSGRTPSSSDGSITFSNLNWTPISSGDQLSIVADLSTSGATAGDVNYFSIGAGDIVLSNGTVAGSFPLNGNNMTISGSTGGVLTVDKSGSLANPNVGQTGVELAEFKLTANTEGAKVARLQLLQAGTINNNYIGNLKLNVNGVTIASGTMTSKGYAVFDMSATPFFIAKGDNRVFQVFGDLLSGSKKGDTVNFYFEVSADVFAMGDQFGFGMSPSFNSMNSSSSTSSATLTLQGGVLTLSFVGPAATNVSTNTTKAQLLQFDMTAASNVELRKTAIVLCHATNGSTFDDINVAASASAGFKSLLNVQLINRDTGLAYVGPQDGSAFTTVTTSGVAVGSGTFSGNECASSKRGLAKTFTDVFTINAGQTLHLAVVADVKTSNNTAGAVNFASGDQFKAVLEAWSTLVGSSGDLTVLKYAGTNTGPTSTDIVPSSNVSGNSMTVQGSSLTVALSASQPTGNRNYVKGTNSVNVNGLAFSAALGSNLTVTSVTLQGYAGAANTSVATTGNPGALISAIRLIDGDTGAIVSSTPSSNNLSLTSGTGSGKVTFSNLNWVIPGGATKNLVAQVDLATNAPPTNSVMAFDIGATTDVTALDQSSNTLNSSNSGVNISGTTATTYVTVASAGTLAIAKAPDTPVSAPVFWGQQQAPFSKFKFTSTNEGFFIQRLNLYNAAGSSNVVNNIDQVTLSYLNKAGQTVTTTGSFNSNASMSFGLSSTGGAGGTDNQIYVSKDGIAYVTVNANIKSAASLFRTDGSNFSIDVSVNPNSTTNGDEFRAVGEGSGTVLTGASGSSLVGTPTNQTANVQYIYRSYPQFTYIPPTGSTIGVPIAAGTEVLRFSVNALGLASDGATVFFDGATGTSSGSIKFAVVASGEQGTSTILGFDLRRVVDGSGASVDQLVASRSLTSGTDTGFNTPGAYQTASLSMRFQDVPANQSVEIVAGQSNTFVLRLNSATSGFNKSSSSSPSRTADNVQVFLLNKQAGNANWTDRGGPNRLSSPSSVANILKNLPINGPYVSR